MSAKKTLVPTSALLTALGTVSFPASVSAQDAENSFVLSFDGAVGTGDHASAYGEAKLGSGFPDFDDDVAFVGSVGLSRAINDNWDWSLSVSRLGYVDNSVSEGFDLSDASPVITSKRSTVVFTFGRDLALGPASARLGLGLAYAKASNEKGLDLVVDDTTSRTNIVSTEFQGIGPHISLDAQSAPVSKDGKLSLIGGIEASLLAGDYQNSKGFEAYDPVSGNMMTAGIKVGLQYDANESTTFRAGVRHDVTRMENARVTIDPSTIDQVSVNDSRTSFFVGMDVRF